MSLEFFSSYLKSESLYTVSFVPSLTVNSRAPSASSLVTAPEMVLVITILPLFTYLSVNVTSVFSVLATSTAATLPLLSTLLVTDTSALPAISVIVSVTI